MTNRPVILTWPYLSMWVWLIVPLTLLVIVPFIDLSDRYLSLHLGVWAHEIDRAESIGEAWRMLRQEHEYHECLYVGIGTDASALYMLPPDDRRCDFVRLMHRTPSQLMGLVPHAESIERFKQSL